MSNATLLKGHVKNNWVCDLLSDGTIELYSIYKMRPNVWHSLAPGWEVEPTLVPKYVYAMYLEAVREAKEWGLR